MFLKNLKNIAILAALLLSLGTYSIADSIDGESVAFASFISELVKTTRTAKNNSICLFGSDEISQVILERDKDAIGLDRDLKSLSSCKAVYVAKTMDRAFRIDVEKFHREKVMTISVIDSFNEIGGMIQVQMGRRNFELIVNSKELKASGVRLNGLITSLIIN
jgi:hypothetical protein